VTVVTHRTTEDTVTSIDLQNETSTGADATKAVDLKLEVVVLPVADVDRAKAFYASLDWRLDADVAGDDGFRVVQFTPPGSPASIIFGSHVTAAEPGSADSIILAVSDIAAARAGLVARGVDVSEVFHDAGGVFHHAGTDARVTGPAGSYGSFASFSDPDGNGWMLQEITDRLPGRIEAGDVGAIAALLRETAEHHGAYEAVAAQHDWWDWYAAYFEARTRGIAAADAEAAADAYMTEAHGVPAPR
jgi:predicted enzyme related to lactoylglutathione lyase